MVWVGKESGIMAQAYFTDINKIPEKRSMVVIDVKSERQLLFDDLFVALGRKYDQYPYNIKWSVAKVEKHGGSLMHAQLPWEDSTAWFSVLKDGGKYRMWYNSKHGNDKALVVSYAESDDGLNFIRKELNTVEYQGSNKNNIVFVEGEKYGESAEMGNVFYDPHGNEYEKYKMVYTTWEGKYIYENDLLLRGGTLRGAASPDGIHWQKYYQIFYGNYCDSQNAACWDETLGKFIIYHRCGSRYGEVDVGNYRIGPDNRGRSIGRIESPDYRHWSQSEVALQPDILDGLNVDIYNSGYSMYPGAPNCHFMFPSFYRHYEGTMDVQVCTSRDNKNWTRATRETFIPLGKPGEFDSYIIYVSPGFIPIDNDHYALYYRATDRPHPGSAPVMSEEEMRSKKSHMGRVVIKRERIVGIEAGDDIGRFSTRPLKFSGKNLFLNIEPIGPEAELRVQLLSAETNEPIEGYTFDKCEPMSADSLDAVV